MEKEKFNATKYKNEFIKDNYDRINLSVPTGYKDLMKKRAKEKAGGSVNLYILDLIKKDLGIED